MNAPDVQITDTTLRDGSHAMSHQFTEEQVRDTVRALDAAGVPVVEVTHGDGSPARRSTTVSLSRPSCGSSRPPPRRPQQRRSPASCSRGVGTVKDTREAAAAGAQVMRIATHCTEADISIQHFGLDVGPTGL